MLRILIVMAVIAGCSSQTDVEVGQVPSPSQTTSAEDNATPTDLVLAIDQLLVDLYTTEWDFESVDDVVAVGDVRAGWLLADLMRFYQTGPAYEELIFGFSELTGAPQDGSQVGFVWATNHLLAADVPAYEGYIEHKEAVFTPVEDRWEQFFTADVSMDWRLVTWGGVLADERPLDDNGPCNCIPALDHPPTTDAAGGSWYEEDRIVFGLVVGDEALALPKHQMEFHEMVNTTLDGREIGIPYCTLCGSAQAYYLDDVAGTDRLVLRTSGLLQRSNKLMYDLTTGSAINTFTGEALTGPLAEAGVKLEQISVVASTWGQWKTAHPDTRILARDGGVGRVYANDPLRGRDDDGPIFPVGPVDPRLPVQEKVIGVITADGTPVAFPVAPAVAALATGPIEYEGLTVRLADSLRVYDEDGDEVISHESFWFGWSQFHPDTVIWDDFGS